MKKYASIILVILLLIFGINISYANPLEENTRLNKTIYKIKKDIWKNGEDYEQIDPVATVLFSGTMVVIEDELTDSGNLIYQVQTNEYFSYDDGFADARFIKILDTKERPKDRDTTLPKIEGLSSDEIISKLKPLDLIVWKGHVMIVASKDRLIESRHDFNTTDEGFLGGVRVTNLKPIIDDLILSKIGVNDYNDEVPEGKKKFVIRRWFPENLNESEIMSK